MPEQENSRESQLENEINAVKVDAYDQLRNARQQIEQMQGQMRQAIGVFSAVAEAAGIDVSVALENPSLVINKVEELEKLTAGAASPVTKGKKSKAK